VFNILMNADRVASGSYLKDRSGHRDASCVEGKGTGEGISLPSRLGGLMERRSFLEGVQGRVPAENEHDSSQFYNPKTAFRKLGLSDVAKVLCN